MISSLIVVYSGRGHAVDGIRDHSERLLAELSRRDSVVGGEYLDLRAGRGGPARALWRLRRRGRRAAILVQYNPFAFARWGFAPWLPAVLGAMRVRRDRPFVGVMVHEPYVPMETPKWVILGLWQRLQLAAVRTFADVTFTSITAWEEALRRQRPRGAVHHLPVGSNFPDRRTSRREMRRKVGVGDDGLVIAAVGRDHPSWMADHVVAAANAVSADRRDVLVMLLGATAPTLEGLSPMVRLERPGMLDAPELAERLAAADLFLAPLIDGVSTRRGSVMAGLQHGLPVVGTEGPLTDALLGEAEGALALSPAGRPDEFAALAALLATDPARRERMGAQARALYEREFDWPVVVDRLLAGLPG